MKEYEVTKTPSGLWTIWEYAGLGRTFLGNRDKKKRAVKAARGLAKSEKGRNKLVVRNSDGEVTERQVYEYGEPV